MFENKTETKTQAKPIKYMTNLGIFVQSTRLHINGDKVVLNSFLRDGKPKWREQNFEGKLTKSIGFSSADTNTYVYVNDDFMKGFIEKGLVHKSDDGQFLQIEAEIFVSPLRMGDTAVSMEDLGLV